MKEKNKKSFNILGISIWKLCAYFIIYSFLGYIIETLFGIATKGLWECRQSFLYGPFCGIYGMGAVAIILFSKYFNKNNLTFFLGGFIIGSITEYIVSFLVEIMMGTRWWEYSDRILNVNGRICLTFSIFWGVLTLFLIKCFNPQIDKIIEKIKNKFSIKVLKVFILIITIFLLINCIATCYAQKQFINRMIVEKGIEVENKQEIIESYEKTYNNEFLSNFILTIWNDKKMIRTFPNMKIEDINHNVIYLDSLLPDIQPYYLKVFDKK